MGVDCKAARNSAPTLNIESETDSEKVLRRKDEKNFEKRVKRLEIVE